MPQGGHLVARIAVSAVSAGIRRIARLVAGRLGHGSRVVMFAVGRDGDRQVAGDLRQPVPVLDPRVGRQLQVLVVLRRGADAVQHEPLLETHHEVDLSVAGAVYEARVAVAGMGFGRVVHVGAFEALRLVDGDGGSRGAGDRRGHEDLAAYGACPVLIVVGDLRQHDLITVLANGAGVGRKAVGGAGRRRIDHFRVLVLAGRGIHEVRIVEAGVLAEPLAAVGEVRLQVRGVLAPLRRRHVGLAVVAAPQRRRAAVVMQILVLAVSDVVDLLVVHRRRVRDLVDQLLQIGVQRVELIPVPVVLELDLVLEVLMRVKRLVDGRLVFRYVVYELALGAPAVAVGTVVRLAEPVVPAAGAHGVVQIPDGTRVEFVRVRRSVPVEQDAARADVVVLVVLVHQIHLGEALDVDVVGIVLALGIVSVGGADGVPGVLKPGLDLLRLSGQIRNALVGLAVRVVPEEVVPHLLDGDAVVARRPAGGLLQALQRELGIAAVGDGGLLVVVLLHHVSGLRDEGIRLGRDGIAALVLAVHPHVGGGGILADPHLIGHMEADPVAQQAAVEDLGEERPLFRL